MHFISFSGKSVWGRAGSALICRVVVGMSAGGFKLGFDMIPTSLSFSCAKLDPRTATTIHQWTVL